MLKYPTHAQQSDVVSCRSTYRRCCRMSSAVPRIPSPPTAPLRFTEATMHKFNKHLILALNPYIIYYMRSRHGKVYLGQRCLSTRTACSVKHISGSKYGSHALLRTTSEIHGKRPSTPHLHFQAAWGRCGEAKGVAEKPVRMNIHDNGESRCTAELVRRTLPVKISTSEYGSVRYGKVVSGLAKADRGRAYQSSYIFFFQSSKNGISITGERATSA
jgi:uncharacterized low-complexity protein